MNRSEYESAFKENVYSVSQVNDFVKELIEGVPVFSGIRVRGEISNFVRHRSGHLYFSLKDEDSVIKAVMFARDAQSVKAPIADGMKVVASGRLAVYKPSGSYQLVISKLELDGKGALYEAYERLKNKLEAEGLFSDEYKKPLPKYPKTVGVITSPTGAAVRDIINVTGRRFPLAKILVYPALVQGDGSEASLIRGVRYFTQNKNADVVIIGRGGGSIEDLWSFNSEALARTIAASPIPFISAVGHETDFTICDFVCTLRAPTPSGAAELAVPDINAIKNEFDFYLSEIKREMKRKTDRMRQRLDLVSGKKVLLSPYGFIDEKRQRLDAAFDKLESINRLRFTTAKADFLRLSKQLNALSPLAVLSRGYGAVYDEMGEVLTSVKAVSQGSTVNVKLADGTLSARVESIKQE